MSDFTSRRALRAVITAALLLQPPIALAGGKAEPNRIAFQRGKSSASLQGSLKGAEEAEYIVGAKASQRLTLSVSAVPSHSVVVELESPSGAPVPLQSPRASAWTCVLPENGDYLLVCKAAQPSKTAARYTLTVAIQ